jgi:hypothetical protein
MSVDSFKFMPRSLAESMKVWPYVDTSGEEIPWTPLTKKVKDCHGFLRWILLQR